MYKANLPLIVTNTGCVFRDSLSGRDIRRVKIEPKLVPIQSVGTSVKLSVKLKIIFISINPKKSTEKVYITAIYI